MIRWLGRRLRHPFYRGQHVRRPRREAGNHTLIYLLPRTPPPPPLELDPWPPRITRWVRIACPLPDDTLIGLPAVLT